MTRSAQPCEGCRNGTSFAQEFTMAFQPIVDVETGRAFAYEALIRTPDGRPAGEVLRHVTPENRYAFDQSCRVKAIELAARAGLIETGARLSINFLPNAVYSPKACIQLTLATAAATQFPTDRLLFEFTENEPMLDADHVANIVRTYAEMGFGTALDDFGAGHAGLTLLARFQPDVIKLDMELVRGIDASLPRRLIVESIARLCDKLGILLIAEGIETEPEFASLRGLGLRYFQGFLLARPGFEHLPAFTVPAPRAIPQPAAERSAAA
jgi:EAL domain-containing protein (putative c-di-GMP-specific phosphodiesterase class I)